MYSIYYFEKKWKYVMEFASKKELMDWICKNQQRKDLYISPKREKACMGNKEGFHNEILDHLNMTGNDLQRHGLYLWSNYAQPRYELRPWMIMYEGRSIDLRTQETCDYINKFYSSASSRYGVLPIARIRSDDHYPEYRRESVPNTRHVRVHKYHSINMAAIRCAAIVLEDEDAEYNLHIPTEKSSWEYHYEPYDKSWKNMKIEKQWQKHKNRHKDTCKKIDTYDQEDFSYNDLYDQEDYDRYYENYKNWNACDM